MQVLRGHVQILRRRFEFRVTEPRRDRVQRPSGFELSASGFMPEIVEVQIDLGELRTVLGRELTASALASRRVL